jgi:hypothetical protein
MLRFGSRLPKQSETFQDNQDYSRFIETFKMYPDILTLSKFFEGLQAQKSQQIEKS